MTPNSFIRDLDLGEINRLDGRRIEVIADGLSLWQEAQFAIDTTLVFPLHRDGSARRGAASRPALEQARWRKEATCPELVGDDGRARWWCLLTEQEGRWSTETAQFLRGLAKGRVGTTSHAKPCQGSMVEKVELHLGCNKGVRIVPPGTASEPRHRSGHPF